MRSLSTALAAPFLLSASLLAVAPLMPAQSGKTDWAPMANPDPRLAAIHAKMTRTSAPGQLALSPDGTLLAYTQYTPEGASFHLATLPGDPHQDKIIALPAGCTASDPTWSPDSQTLAYTSSCENVNAQIALYSRGTGGSKTLTQLKGLFDQAKFSPDGKSIAFLYVEGATRSAGALAAMKPWSGVIGEDGVEVQRVYGVDTSNGHGNFLTPETMHAFEFDWSPTSEEIAYIAAPTPGENNWWIAKLYAQGMIHDGEGRIPDRAHIRDTTELIPRVVFDPNTSKSPMHGLQMAVPRFSPNGKQIAFIGGLMSDQGSTGGDVWVVPAAGGEPTDVTPGIDGSPTYEAWLANDIIGMVEDRRGHTVAPDYTVSTRTMIPGSMIDFGETSVGGGSIKDEISISTRARKLAVVKAGHDTAPEIWIGNSQGVQQFTHLNDGAKPPTHTESIEWTNDGFHVQGWLTYPAQYDPAKKYPLIVQVHGGPSASAGARWGGGMLWAELGYFQFTPNPRGSFGQGEAFTAANVKDFGYGDLRDILTGVDAVEKKVSIDKTREGLTGWSYGGFMTMFGVTQTTRFRAAIAGAGISDWKSYYGENSIDQWMTPFFGATVYDDPAAYAKSSAIDFIKQVKTPTLVVVGDRDGECPAPQSFEFWHALRAEHVQTQLVVYPNEGHHFVDPAHARDLEAREVAWFAKYMPAS